MNDLLTAIQVTLRVAGQGSFWSAMFRALLGPALLVVVAATAALYLLVDVRSIFTFGFTPRIIATALALLVCLILIGPLLMRSWCPPAARAVVEAMQLDMPELPVPSLARFVAVWLLVSIVGIVLAAAAMFIPRPFHWIMLLPMAFLFSGYHVRCALCLHASAEERFDVVGNTFFRRALVWFPVAGLPLFLYEKCESALKAMVVPPYEFTASTTSKVIDVLGVAAGLAVFAVVLVLWAALSLQALHDRRARAALAGRPVRRPSPQPSASPRSSLPVPAAGPQAQPHPETPALPRKPLPVQKILLVTLGVLMCAAVLAYVARVPLMHQYLIATDADYAQEAMYNRDRTPAEALATALAEAGCRGNLPRVKLLMRIGIALTPDSLGSALICAAKTGQMEVVVFLIGKKANVNAMPVDADPARHLPITPLQNAVATRNGAIVDLLMSKGADVSLQAPDGLAPLHFAAADMNTELIAKLIQAGARPDSPNPRAPIFYFVEAAAASQADTSAAGWAAVIAKAERAGLWTSGLDAEGGNLLHWAAARGELGLIEVLLARGLDRHQKSKRGAMPFMHLANWYQYAGEERGPELEYMLKALTSGVADINVAASFRATRRTSSGFAEETAWTMAMAAAAKPRIRAVFGDRISYAGLSEQQWALKDREQAMLLVTDLSAAQLAAAPGLAVALRAKGWDDVAVQAESKR